jgi:hypothetical protein
VAAIMTPSTSVVIPPGLMQVGRSYVFEINAFATPGLDLAATPARLVLPQGRAKLITGIATP